MVRGVPEDTIKGAALAAAALVAVASKGVVVTSAAGLSAAYIAISQGVAGDIFRTVGSFAWDATEAAATIYQKLTANKNLAGMSEEFASKVMNAVQNTQKKASQLQEVSKSSGSNIKDNINTADVKEAETAFFDSQEELARVLLEAETAIDAADAAIAKADALGDDGDNEKVQTLDDETAQLEKEARLAEIAAKEAEARLAEEAQVAEEERLVEKKGLKEELRRAEELVRQDKESAADESEDEWEAAVEMSQQGLEGKIVGIDEVITDDDAKAEWDAAGKLAEELKNGVGEDFDDDDDDEMDLAALGKAAREAVEAFEEEMETIEASKKAVRDSWTAEMMSATETTDSDIEAANDMLPDGDGEDIARAAREAVKLMGGDGESYVDEEESFEGFEFSPGQSGETAIAPSPQLRDWAKLTVANLKVELRNRGLKAYGKKVEMVALLERYDLEQLGGVPGGDDDKSEFDTSSLDMMGFETEDFDFEELGRQARAAVEASSTAAESDSSSDDWFFGEDSVDMDALGAQARAAVDANFADEPSDEALQQLESEEITRFEEPSARSSKDWSKMTVIQLKNELRSRGLRVSGKKDELIERLQSS